MRDRDEMSKTIYVKKSTASKVVYSMTNLRYTLSYSNVVTPSSFYF